jgi:hypothetical protein
MKEIESESTQTNQAIIARVIFKDLPLKEQLPIMWAWFWRQLFVSAIAGLVALVPIVLLTLLFHLLFPISSTNGIEGARNIVAHVQASSLIVGTIVGFFSLLPLIGWLTRDRFGGHELWLVRVAKEPPTLSTNSRTEDEFICEACGSSIKWGNAYCTSCGSKLEYDEQQPNNTTSSSGGAHLTSGSP